MYLYKYIDICICVFIVVEGIFVYEFFFLIEDFIKREYF